MTINTIKMGCSARRRHFVGGGAQRAGQRRRLRGCQVVGRKIQADHPDPSRGAVLADNIAHDKIAGMACAAGGLTARWWWKLK
jgi:hypothetical protein